ncbi:hypothetical protein [Mycolicibacterium vinylchloridicum]|uniref:hypothetical protein n=1 Tax=Mycolicibacterium vinylchloridicum TaxID=2736928 RepID=UPI0015C8D0F8|nr:hypothetical protein [Mycolicibacterium vinylchloridicum]
MSLAVTGVLVVVSVDVCSLAVASPVEVVSAAVSFVDDVVELLDVRRDVASERPDEPDAVDDAATAVFFDDADDLLVADDEAVDFGPRAVCPVAFFADPELDVAELDESDAELWSVSSALATAMPGPASESPRARAAIPALAPR